MRKALFVAAVSAALIAGTALPASAATSGATTTTFALSAGALSITVPASSNLGTGAAGGSAFSGAWGRSR